MSTTEKHRFESGKRGNELRSLDKELSRSYQSNTYESASSRCQVVGSADDGWAWDVTFDLVYELSARNKDEGLYGVVSHLIDDRGTEIDRVEYGDLAWKALSTDERTEKRNENESYRGTRRETVSTTAGRFPRWIVFTADRAVKSGYSVVSVYGATTDRPISLPTESDGGERNDTVSDQQRSENETAPDRDRISVTNDDWERIRLGQFLSFPPTDEITNANESDANASGDSPTDTENDTLSSR